MKKILFSLVFITVAVVATACAEQTVPPTPTPIIVLDTVIPPTPEFSCTVIDVLPTPLAGQQSLVPPITDADFSIGPADAPVTILEYCDFQSDICLAMAQTIAELMRNYPGSIRLIFRPFPLTEYLDKSDDALLAAFAANEQKKF